MKCARVLVVTFELKTFGLDSCRGGLSWHVGQNRESYAPVKVRG